MDSRHVHPGCARCRTRSDPGVARRDERARLPGRPENRAVLTLDPGDLDACAAPLALRDLYRPAVCLHDVFHDAQAEPGPVGRCGVATLEQALGVGGEPATVVCDVEPRLVVEHVDRDRHVRATVFDGVPDEVLQHGRQPVPVGLQGQVGRAHQCRGGRLDVAPGLPDDTGQLDRLCLTDCLALSGECEQLVDEPLHPVECTRYPVDVVAVCLLGEQFEPEIRHVQRVPQVVGDEAGELLESFGLPGERRLALDALDRGRRVAHEQLDEGDVGVVERAGLGTHGLEDAVLPDRDAQSRLDTAERRVGLVAGTDLVDDVRLAGLERLPGQPLVDGPALSTLRLCVLRERVWDEPLTLLDGHTTDLELEDVGRGGQCELASLLDSLRSLDGGRHLV